MIIDTSSDPSGPGQGPQGPWAGSGGGRPGSHGRVIGEVDQFSAPVLVHDDAIYLHEGRQYHVERLDWEEKRAYVHPIGVDHYTLAETRRRRGRDRRDARRAAGACYVARHVPYDAVPWGATTPGQRADRRIVPVGPRPGLHVSTSVRPTTCR